MFVIERLIRSFFRFFWVVQYTLVYSEEGHQAFHTWIHFMSMSVKYEDRFVEHNGECRAMKRIGYKCFAVINHRNKLTRTCFHEVSVGIKQRVSICYDINLQVMTACILLGKTFQLFISFKVVNQQIIFFSACFSFFPEHPASSAVIMARINMTVIIFNFWIPIVLLSFLPVYYL